MRPAPEAVQRRLWGNEKVFAYLDDVVVVCSPGRVAEVEGVLREEVRRHAHIDVHQGKSQVWNRLGVTPGSIEELVRVARLEKPDAFVREGDLSLPRELQGTRVLGAPIGSPEYVADQLQKKSDKQAALFTRIPRAQDTQACWLLLLVCASTRANFWLRMVTPEQTPQFAERHDAAVWECLRAILGVPLLGGLAPQLATLSLELRLPLAIDVNAPGPPAVGQTQPLGRAAHNRQHTTGSTRHKATRPHGHTVTRPHGHTATRHTAHGTRHTAHGTRHTAHGTQHTPHSTARRTPQVLGPSDPGTGEGT